MPHQLRQAITLIKSGERQKARQLLAHIIKTNPRNEDAWLWMSSVVESDDQRCHCLKQVLLINPNNSLAHQGLEKLKAKPYIVSKSKPEAPPQEQNPLPKSAQPSQSYEVQPPKVDSKKNDEQRLRIKRQSPTKKLTGDDTDSAIKPQKASSTPGKPSKQSMPVATSSATKDTSSLGMGCLGAIVGMIIFTLLWGFIVGITRVHMDTMAGIVMVLGIAGLVGGLVRLLGQGHRAVFGVIAAISSLVTYIWGIYLTMSGSRGAPGSFLSNVFDEENFSLFLLFITFGIPFYIISFLIVMLLSFGIVVWRPRRQSDVAQPDTKESDLPLEPHPQQSGVSSRAWGAIVGLVIVGCLGLAGAWFRQAEAVQIIVGLFVIALGYYPIAGAIMNWDWFMKGRRIRLFVTLLGRNGARVVLALAGVFILFLGFVIILG